MWQSSRDTEHVVMKCVQFPSALALLGLGLVLCGHGAASQPDQDQKLDFDLELRHHRLLQRARAAGLVVQDWSKRAVEDLLSQLSLPEAETKQEAEVVSTETGRTKEDSLRLELERSVDNPNSLPPRERKAGCKNFYWKGFTSC